MALLCASVPVFADSIEEEIANFESIASRAVFPIDLSNLPPYGGGINDYDYLRDYVLAYAEQVYGVDPEVFDEATILSTGLLRDLVHKFNYSGTVWLSTLLRDGTAVAPARQDIAETWRYPSRGICGQLSFTLFSVYRAFGFPTNRISAINGQYGVFREGDSYTESHVTTEVYLPSLDRFVIQDPTYNTLLLSDTGQPLGWVEAQSIVADTVAEGLDPSSSPITFDTTWVATGYPGRPDTNLPDVPNVDVVLFLADYLDIPNLITSWSPSRGELHFDLATMFRSARNAHGPAGVGRGDTSGFELIDSISGEVVSTWDTTRNADGSYTSENRTNRMQLNGSYDQLTAEALNGSPVRNPGADLGDFRGVANIIDLRGERSLNPLIETRKLHTSQYGDLQPEAPVASGGGGATGYWSFLMLVLLGLRRMRGRPAVTLSAFSAQR